MTLRFLTAGESHGPELAAILEGLPAGLELDAALINRELARRQAGYGAGPRMKLEQDEARILGGVMEGRTTGAPLALTIANLDHARWRGKAIAPFTIPRPGHADLTGTIKYGYSDLRPALERSSARETAARVAAGGLAKLFLRELGMEVLSHVVALGAVSIPGDTVSWEQIVELSRRDEVLLNCADAEAEQRMKAEVDDVYKTADTVGGVFEVRAHNVPPGLGSYVNWDERLDTRLAAAVMSVQAVKAVEIGSGTVAASSRGSAVHDEIGYDTTAGFTRRSNRAGGLEGGVTNGKDVIVRGYLKPISTLRRPLESVDFATREPVKAAYERSDVCVVPAAGVIGEAMVALTLAQAALEKFGGDSLGEVKRNFEGYLKQLKDY